MKKNIDTLYRNICYVLIISIIICATPLNYFGSYRRIPIYLCTIFLLVYRFNIFIKKPYIGKIFLFFLLTIASFLLRNANVGLVFEWMAPLVLVGTIKRSEKIIFRKMGYIFIAVFVLNCLISIYERFTMSYLLNYNVSYLGSFTGELQSNGLMFDNVLTFRPMALFGHPLTNANIMSMLIFTIYYSDFCNKLIRFSLASLGMFSLFCFNSRGALMISCILFVPIFIDILVTKDIGMFGKLVIGIVALAFSTIVIANIYVLGGRLFNADLSDDSSNVRIDAIKYFMSISLEDLLLGGNILKYQENGFLMILEELGLIFGSIFVYLHAFFSWKHITTPTKVGKLSIFISFFVVACTNSNLYYPILFALFMLTLISIDNSQKNIYKNEFR